MDKVRSFLNMDRYQSLDFRTKDYRGKNEGKKEKAEGEQT